MTPTTAAGMAVRGAVNPTLLWVVSIKGPPVRIKMKEGKKVNHVTRQAATVPAKKGRLAPDCLIVRKLYGCQRFASGSAVDLPFCFTGAPSVLRNQSTTLLMITG